MEQPIILEDSGRKLLISLDKRAFDQEVIMNFLNRLQIEYLARKAELGEEVEQIGEEIKSTWWEKNKSRFIDPIK